MCLQHASILQLANLSWDYIAVTDTSNFSIGVALSHVWEDGEHPIAYESRKLNVAVMNYPIHEQEFLSIVHAFEAMEALFIGQAIQD